MKKIALFGLIFALLLTLCACGGGEEATENNTTEATECPHAFADATCNAPKTCTLCGETRGQVLEHTYSDGACTLCGKQDTRVLFTDHTWVGYSVAPCNCETAEKGDVLTQVILDASWRNFFAYKEYYTNQNYGTSYGSITYEDKTFYDFWFSSEMGGITVTDNGDTVTVVWMDYIRTIDLERISDNEFTVVYCSDNLLPEGTIFKTE